MLTLSRSEEFYNPQSFFNKADSHILSIALNTNFCHRRVSEGSFSSFRDFEVILIHEQWRCSKRVNEWVRGLLIIVEEPEFASVNVPACGVSTMQSYWPILFKRIWYFLLTNAQQRSCSFWLVQQNLSRAFLL